MCKTTCESVVESMGSIVDWCAGASGVSSAILHFKLVIEWYGLPIIETCKPLFEVAVDVHFVRVHGRSVISSAKPFMLNN